MAVPYLKGHMEGQHGIIVPQTMEVEIGGGGGTSNLYGVLPPVCPVVAYSIGRLRKHFMYRKNVSWIVVVQEGKDLLPCCDLCSIQMSERWLIKHQINRGTTETRKGNGGGGTSLLRADAPRCPSDSWGTEKRNTLRVWRLSRIWKGNWNGQTMTDQWFSGILVRSNNYVDD